MKMMRQSWMGAVAVAGVALMLAVAGVRADIPTAFTYQGRLSDGSSGANGTFDFIFDLHSGMTGGTAAHTMSTNNVPVTDGYFEVFLDFGDDAFTGAFRALEIRVRSHGSGTYETLSPRQPILPTPYAMCADSVTDGAVTSAKLGVNAVTEDKILSGAVSNPKLAVNAVSTDRLQNGAVDSTKLADSAVTTHKLQGGAVSDTKLANDAVSSTKILNGSILEWDLADGAVAGDKIAAGTITAANVATDGGIYSSKSRIYEVWGEAVVQPGFCVWAVAECNDANDLPLMGMWDMPSGDLIVQGTSTEDWDSLTAPAEFKAEMCFLSGTSATTVMAGILCVEVD